MRQFLSVSFQILAGGLNLIFWFFLAVISWTYFQAVYLNGNNGFDLSSSNGPIGFAVIYGLLFCYWFIAGIALAEIFAAGTVEGKRHPVRFFLFVVGVFVLSNFVGFVISLGSGKIVLFYFNPFGKDWPLFIPVGIFFIKNYLRGSVTVLRMGMMQQNSEKAEK